MNGFIKISNTIFNYSLSSKALFVYAYLMSKVNCLMSTTATYEAIGQACNMDTKTAQAAVKELVSKELISKQNRFNARGYIANRYYIKNLIVHNKGWFKIERSVFKTTIKATDFVVFCFIRKSMSSTHQEAFPSLSAICNGTSISRGRVAKATAYLRQFTFINRIKRHYKRTNAYRHNRYMHFKCNLNEVKKIAPTTKVRTQFNNIYIVPFLSNKVNCFFIEGSTHFP